MASLITVRLNKGDASNWGFRLQGGKDFGTPLVIQKVNGGSPAERAGLIAGDSVIKINSTDVFNLRHKEAQDVVVRAGPAFEMTIQRGGSTWKPSVTPVGSFPSTTSSVHNITPVTKTSLASNKQDNIGAIGTGHNLSAKPFNAQVNGTVNGGPKVVNNQYNSPLKLYSEESIAETLSAQTEVLATGALGVNFKKNEKNYDASNSAVFRMVQEADKEPKAPEPEPESGVVTTPLGVGGLRHVTAPETKPAPSTPQLPPGQNICADCERLIVGVFVRIKDKNLHVECFKCATCGTSLKNVGYYNINNKLYCDIHAKLAALRSNPATPNLVPVTVPPGGKSPVNAISSALSSHSLPSPSPLSPKTNLTAAPFQLQDKSTENNLSVPLQNLNITNNEVTSNNQFNNNLNNVTPLPFNKYISKVGNNLSGPKPFSSVSAPLSPPTYKPLPKTTPLSPVSSVPLSTYSPISSTGHSVQNIVWPPLQEEPEAPTACPLYFPPPSQVQSKFVKQNDSQTINELESDNYLEQNELEIMSYYQQPKMSAYSTEVSSISSKSAFECVETISDTLETQKLVENVLRKIPQPSSESKQIKDASVVEKIQIKEASREEVQATEEISNNDLRRPADFNPQEVPYRPPLKRIENAVPKKWESPMVQALKTIPDSIDDPFSQIPTKRSTSALGSALAIAPVEPFRPQSRNLEPVPLPEETVPYFPEEHPIIIEPKQPKTQKSESQFVKALSTMPEQTASTNVPVRKKKDPTDKFLAELPKSQEKLSMLTALTTAPDRPYSPFSSVSVKEESTSCDEQSDIIETKTIERSTLHKPLKPSVLPVSFTKIVTEEEPKAPGMYPLFKGFSCSFENKSDLSQFKIEICTTPPIPNTTPSEHSGIEITSSQDNLNEEEIIETETSREEKHISQKSSQKHEEKETIARQAENIVIKRPLPLASALKKPEGLPQYQVNLSESVQADLELMNKIEAAQSRHEMQKTKEVNICQSKQQQMMQESNIRQSRQECAIQKPIIAIQYVEARPENSFQPVNEDRPQNLTFSPRPRSITPSMINKPAPVLPYYQASLVCQEYKAPTVNLLDPASPSISRSPSPCHDSRRRTPSPFTVPSSSLRPKSPAAGVPPNPLKAPQPPPTPKDFKIEEARKNVTNYIPQYQSKVGFVDQSRTVSTSQYGGNERVLTEERKQGNFRQSNIQQGSIQQRSIQHGGIQQGSINQANFQQSCLQKGSNTQSAGMQSGKMQIKESQSEQRLVSENAGYASRMSEKSNLAHMEQLKKFETQSTEKSNDGMVQIQRHKTVTEEFEKTHKSQTIEIQKNVSKGSNYGVQLQPTVPPFIKNEATKCLTQNTAMTCSNKFDSLSKESSSKQESCTKSSQSCCQSIPSKPIPPTVQPSAPLVKPPAINKPPQITLGSSIKPNQNVTRPNVPIPNTGSGGGRQAGAIGVAPKRGRGVLNAANLSSSRVPLCGQCHSQIRGPFITALGKIWCPDHFVCATPSCRRPLQDLGFVEEQGQLYCEFCFEKYLAPPCSKCGSKIKGDCLKAIGKNFHPECFNCFYCGKLFGNNPFFLEDGNPYCDTDWNELFTTKCFACGFPVEAGDRWVEALNNNYHSQCFNCTMCKKNLEGQSFFAKGGRPFCKTHAR